MERGVGKILRRGGGPHRLGEAEAVHEFHRARIEGGGARMVRRTFALLDHEAGDPPQPEIGCERQTHQARSGSEFRQLSAAPFLAVVLWAADASREGRGVQARIFMHPGAETRARLLARL